MPHAVVRGAFAATVTASVVLAGLVGVSASGATEPTVPSAVVGQASPQTDVPGARVFAEGGVPRGQNSEASTGAVAYKDIDGEYVNTQRYYSDFSGSGLEYYTAHYTGYYGADDASWPRIGDTFYVHMTSGNVSPRTGAAPIMGLLFDNALAPDVEYAITGSTPVTCWFYDGSAVSRDTTNCFQSPSPAPGAGQSFGGRPLGSGQSFDVRVPIVVKKPKSGIGSGTAALFAQYTTVGVGASPDPVLARQWMFVADRSAEFYGLYATGIGNGSATTNGTVYPFWKSGNIYFDRGLAANNYSYTSPPDPFDSSFPGWKSSVTWSSLAPSTTYHWRMRVVLSSGQSYASPNQSFTTPASGVTSQPSPTTGVTATTAPPGSTIAPAPTITAPSASSSTPTSTISTTSTAAPVDTTPPIAPRLVAPLTAVSLSTTLPVRWSLGEPDATVQVQRAVKPPGGVLGAYANVGVPNTSTTFTMTGGRPGYGYCFRVQARDRAGNASPWSASRCATVAADDRVMAASRTGWARPAIRTAYLRTLSTSRSTGATLTLARSRGSALAVIVNKGPGGGVIGVYVKGKRVAVITTAAARAALKVAVPVRVRTAGTPVVLRVDNPGSRGVSIDGIAQLP